LLVCDGVGSDVACARAAPAIIPAAAMETKE